MFEMILPLTHACLRAHPHAWDDGYLAFGAAPIDSAMRGKEAVFAFFGARHTFSTLSSHGDLELLLTERALKRIPIGSAHRALVGLIEQDLHMMSCRQVERHVLDDIASVFFQEMCTCEVYMNTQFPSDGRTVAQCSWTPVTRHTQDIFLCALNDACLGYWLYIDDE
ncbi:hypothetical protein [Massilia genomosp. 1]|uniref:Uncharacterized protein n=1 Tax=Massilia genomosp. 1 TaxID=2609280 RepID=A0ABX0MJC6_9BURK|nr:hypothetical protein [Massilia genomosp. 1]NHZ62879.1 hypothetical protein [Massilia genomosp. 1]